MLEQVLRYLNNWFATEIWAGAYTVQDGSIALDFLQENQYFRIVGSIFNDGVYQYNDKLELTDETFNGAVWALAIPRALILIVDEIEKWSETNGEGTSGPYSSESFGGYSYSKLTSKDGSAATWRDVFGAMLAPYKKLRDVTAVEARGYSSPPYWRPFNLDNPYGEVTMLLEQYARNCTLLIPVRTESAEGGCRTEWTDGETFIAYIALSNSSSTRRGEQEGYSATFNVHVDKSVSIMYGDYFRDEGGGTFLVTTEPDMKQSPGSASFSLKNFTAVREDTP